MSLAPPSNRLPYVIAAVWLAATVSLAVWWLVVGLDLANQVHSGSVLLPQGDFRRMFVWEGATFIALLVAGGLAMALAIRRENIRRRAVDAFFMSFTHDLKTSLASIQLQAEGLHEDWPDPTARVPVARLLEEMVRLQIQLENSLFVAQPDGRLLAERIDVAADVKRLAADWPSLHVQVTGTGQAIADARGFEVVVRNLLQNAVVHGGARDVRVDVRRLPAGSVRVTMADDGSGVPADVIARLGQPFERHAPTSGSGVGLFVSGQLVRRMHGALRFLPGLAAQRGFTIELDLPGAE
jgi:signal transduction histidine kinase